MCSRYELDESPRAIVQRFGLRDPLPPLPGPELRPTNRALVIVEDGGGRRPRLMHWGLPANWGKRPLINARAETLVRRRTFRPLLGHRCLVPATAYFEWRRENRWKLRNRIAPAGGGQFAFAGLVDGDHFTIVTCAAAPAVAHIHDRMPVILTAEAEAMWAERSVPFAELAALLVPYSAAPLDAAEERPAQRQGDLFGTAGGRSD